MLEKEKEALQELIVIRDQQVERERERERERLMLIPDTDTAMKIDILI